MSKENILTEIKNKYLIIFFSLIVFLNHVNYLRINILDNIVFIPRLLMVIFIIIFLIYIYNSFILNNSKLEKKNLVYFLLFYFQALISLFIFNNDFFDDKKDLSLLFYFSYDFFKYSFIYFFFCIVGLNLINYKNFFIQFKIYFSLSFIFIIFGFFLVLFYNLNDYELIQRVFYYDDFAIVGNRFYSVFGEPRDASVFLITNLCILILLYRYLPYNFKLQIYPLFVLLIFLSIFSFFFTKSFASIVGLILGAFFFSIYFIKDYFLKKNILFNLFVLIILLISLFFVYLIISKIGRVGEYISDVLILLNNPDADIEKLRISLQSKDVVPLLKYAGYFSNFELKNILFGNGTLSSYYLGELEFAHPHSFLSRVLFDNGLFGFGVLTLFVFSVLDDDSRLIDKFLLSMSYGSFLAVHSSSLYILLMFLIYIKKSKKILN